mmetsp:Transcript_19510/g.35738  ORF Transcript_19510/g.35738 Transcript_19510/m.35738 type:complete len:87 (+) Transcript_19510:101-361(+)
MCKGARAWTQISLTKAQDRALIEMYNDGDDDDGLYDCAARPRTCCVRSSGSTQPLSQVLAALHALVFLNACVGNQRQSFLQLACMH